ncbi:isoleucine--tRNA ligase [Rickettsiales endosymbiont of Peranema trichophorum]|uniref:isoleucine--tRNA ligase n=1 Tax=Rickettsiales endosymbiont of Peranema trichophorum TaxID=2486577 RepID=UPI0010238225|nr:isoleucine--tRNA ligase [Rickettsiales endosymbiont of Peranema trichophorum]RZI46030.1 isoleucine--tRNA ligase [Rickettsiales endosymbiont of Peranema trichophorum]
MSNYQEVDTNFNLPSIELDVLKRWSEQGTFKASIKGEVDYVFYDGPPFANGLPHYGHLLTGFIKDAVARYQTMCGKKVERRFGWDCHGLPAEMEIEKKLGLAGTKAIKEYGISKFNESCKESVLRYTREWEEYVTRQARWVDFQNDYKTMEPQYMESVIWAFKQLYDKGLIYESMRVMPYSWACETPVSDFETRMDNAYREKSSTAITVAFELITTPLELSGYGKKCKLLVWTTTPWTLPSNLALAVNRDLRYACVSVRDEILIVCEDLLKRYEKEIGGDILMIIGGVDLVGISYYPLFPYFKNHQNAFKILHGDFVTSSDGTGIVHIAPGFGEDDYELCKQHDIDLVCPVDEGGKFTSPVDDLKGLQVFAANDQIVKALKVQGNWIKTETYIHSYPHCWRTDTPLIYKAVSSWYLNVTALKERLLKNNQQINWIPDHIKNGLFGKWLENAKDWSISRNRFWGCPIPIWLSDDPNYPNIEVYGSIKELEAAFNTTIEDLHLPFIDTLVRDNVKDPTGKSKMRRVPYVLDCWFESGSMPFAQLHYPFENAEWFERHFPADFVVEYLAQTRGWFYTMNVLATALFDKPAFLNCICHGVILGDGGQKLSKRLKNYVDPTTVFDTLGADAMRWYMLSSSVMRGQEVVIDNDTKGIKDSIKNVIKPLWNAHNFFVLYANADNAVGLFDLSSNNMMDRYIISRCFQSIKVFQAAMDNYDMPTASREFEAFFDTLNNWYIRRSRQRFWKAERDLDKLSAYNTLFSVLHLSVVTLAPLLPLLTEAVFLGLQGNKGSVHLERFPDTNQYPIDSALIAEMESVRAACNAALHIRNENSIRTRQPLNLVTFIGVTDNAIDVTLQQLILDEINVKAWENLDRSKISEYASYKLKVKFPVVGKRIPHAVKEILEASKNGVWEHVDGKIAIAGHTLSENEFELTLEPKPEYMGCIASLFAKDALVKLDLNITESLRLEGMARDIVRAVQQSRKNANLKITDKIDLYLKLPNVEGILKEWRDYIMEQTLATCISLSPLSQHTKHEETIEIEGEVVIIQLAVHTGL